MAPRRDRVPAASGTTFDLTDAHVGHRISVRITSTLEQVGTIRTETHDRTITPLPVRRLTSSSLTGIARPGNTLTAQPGRWDGPTTATFQWTRNGVPIPEATGATFLLRPADVRDRIAVDIITTAEHHGIISTDTHRARVERYTSTSRLRLKRKAIAEGQTAVATIRVTAPGVPRQVTGRLRIVDGETTLMTPYLRADRGTQQTFRIRGLEAGRHRIWIRYYGNRRIGRSRTPTITIVVQPGQTSSSEFRWGRTHQRSNAD